VSTFALARPLRRAGTITVIAGLALVVSAGAPAVAGAVPASGSQPHTPAPGFLLSKGRYSTFDVPAATTGTSPIGITNAGLIVGKFNDGTTSSGPGANEHGFVRSRSGRFTVIDLPGIRATTPFRSNDKGQIVGAYSRTFGRVGDDPNRRGFLLDRGKVTWLDVPGSIYTQPFGINNRGQVVGEFQDAGGVYHGFTWERGRFTTVDVPGAVGNTVLDINDKGQMVGFSIDPANPTVAYGYLLSNGRFTRITVPGASLTIAFGINNRGQIVGAATTADSGVTRGFLLAAGVQGPFTRIEVPGSTTTASLDVNDLGQITGSYGRSAPAAGGHHGPDSGPATPGRVASPRGAGSGG
jgi:probable HAF family extracellular repeat protein